MGFIINIVLTTDLIIGMNGEKITLTTLNELLQKVKNGEIRTNLLLLTSINMGIDGVIAAPTFIKDLYKYESMVKSLNIRKRLYYEDRDIKIFSCYLFDTRIVSEKTIKSFISIISFNSHLKHEFALFSLIDKSASVIKSSIVEFGELLKNKHVLRNTIYNF